MYGSRWMLSPAMPKKIGVPCLSLACGDGVSTTKFWQNVANVTVESNSPGLSGIGYEGNIEFTSGNYGIKNTEAILGADDTTYDFGDQLYSSGSYGCMQVHVHGGGGGSNYVGTLFAFNAFNYGSSPANLGIGNNPNGHPDWTLEYNADTYNVRNLQVFVL